MRLYLLLALVVLMPLSLADTHDMQEQPHPRAQELADLLTGLDTSSLGDRTVHVSIDGRFAGCITTGEFTQVVLEPCDAGFDAAFTEGAVDAILGSDDPLAAFFELKKDGEISLDARGFGNSMRLLGFNAGLAVGGLFGLF